ncbi:MAG: STY4526/YPO1902 family pathogenicity island replication protein [Nevskia sp.]|nr:STY4526/YPO1902 family pathogenicity island replication protein [Nevskia sp.]
MIRGDLSERERYERWWDSRTKESELNFAIFIYVSRCLAEGDLDALSVIGFSLEDAYMIYQISLPELQALAASHAHALNVKTDPQSMYWLMEHIHRRHTRELLKIELMRYEAPYEMMNVFFGMNGREYAAARRICQLPSGRGKPTLKTEDDEQRLWQLWLLLVDPQRPERLRKEDLWLIIGRELGSTLRGAWHVIQRWRQDEAMRSLFHAELEKQDPAETTREEQKLREKHGVFKDRIELGSSASRPANGPMAAVVAASRTP